MRGFGGTRSTAGVGALEVAPPRLNPAATALGVDMHPPLVGDRPHQDRGGVGVLEARLRPKAVDRRRPPMTPDLLPDLRDFPDQVPAAKGWRNAGRLSAGAGEEGGAASASAR